MTGYGRNFYPDEKQKSSRLANAVSGYFTFVEQGYYVYVASQPNNTITNIKRKQL